MTLSYDPLHIARTRHQALKTIRNCFDEQEFIEIDAPVLINENAVEAFIDPLRVEVNYPDHTKQTSYLATSPEIYMKRLLSKGAERIYSLGPVFRDRERSAIHLTEFTMLEWYRANADLQVIEEDCVTLFRSLYHALKHRTSVREDLGSFDQFDRLSVAQAWAQFAQIDLEACLSQIASGDQNALARTVSESGEHLRPNADFDDAFTHIMLKKIEPRIGQDRPCILHDWPAQTAALARLVPSNPLFAQRFEIYCKGFELANAFNELTDPVEQRARFEEANHVRTAFGRDILPLPELFLQELSLMPPSSGIAVGVDRLITLMCGKHDLRSLKPLSN